MLENEQKVPYRRLETAVLKFTKVVIPTDLERLKNHQLNIEKYRRCRSWDQLHKEHINAGRTVQQLRANIQDMESLFLQVRNEDVPTLERILKPIKQQSLASVSTFLELQSKSMEDSVFNDDCISDEQNVKTSKDAFCASDSCIQTDVQIVQIQDQIASESWNRLEKDLLDLNEIVNEFSQLVHTQQEKIDSIEDHVNTAAVNVEEGTKNLGKALKYKLSVLPAAGALIGGIVGGPIGLLAGFKVAGVAAAIGGGLLGFTGGKMLQRKKDNTVSENDSDGILSIKDKNAT